MSKIEILDSTLRDGAQGEGISYSVQDKIHICNALDELGVDFIEAGNPGSNPKDMEFFQEMKKNPLKNSKLCAFGSTRRKDIKCAEDINLQSLLAAGTEYVVVFGKSWTFQVTDILRTSLEENLLMIEETCRFLKDNGRKVIYDAEHFFTAFKEKKLKSTSNLSDIAGLSDDDKEYLDGIDLTGEEFFEKYPKVALGFSGGVDSAYLLYAAKKYGAQVQAYFV